MTNWKIRTGLFSYVLGLALVSTTPHEAASFEFEKFSAATSFCSNHRNSIKLSEDRTILCFDGLITADWDGAAFYALKQNGFFVIRSPGGFAPIGVILSNILLAKNATVLVYDYCLSACANYFFIASAETYVTKNTVVAWHGGPEKTSCGPGDLDRMRKNYRDAPAMLPGGNVPPELVCQTGELLQAFFKQRGIDDRHTYAPQTAYTKKMVDTVVRGLGDKRKAFWMWNPQNYGDYFKSRITFESYPTSQDEVDEILRRFRLGARVIYDPPRM
jgi:hypothetical protein